jgi:colicin import membrane protein
MSEPASDRWLSIAMSVLLHGTIIGLLAYGWWHYEHRPITPSVSISATVVDAHTLQGLGVSPKSVPKPPPPQPVSPPQGPPAPTPQELALRQQAAQAEAERLAAAQAEQQRLKQQQSVAQAEAKAQARAKAQAQEKKKARAAERAKAQARARAKALARKQAEARKLAEARRRREAAKQAAEARKLAAERAAKARAARIAQLQQALKEDAQSNAQTRAAVAGWVNAVTQRVEAAWIKPPTARSNLSCTIRVVLVPGGAVSSVSLGQCNGDEAVRESIEAAVYRASPLPPLPDADLYNQPIDFVFTPESP